MQWTLLVILAVVASYFFGGWLPARIVVLLILATAIQFLYPAWIPMHRGEYLLCLPGAYGIL